MSKIAAKMARQRRTRARLRRLQSDRPRLTVHRTLQHIYAQLVDDRAGRTVAAASTKDKELRERLKAGGNIDAAVAVGRLVGERAKAQGINQVRFDRGGFRYHGRIKALADAAREAGLEF